MESKKFRKRIPLKVSLPADVYEWLLKRAERKDRQRGAELVQILKAKMNQEPEQLSQPSL